MLPYQAVAMDYAGYQRQGVPGGHMGMGMSASPFGHSWLVPPQDICGVPYKSNQPSVMQSQPLEPGIIELRKEKSRDAARSRRNKENLEFYELAKMLPLPAAITSQLDKASIIRLSISYLKLRHFSGHGNPPWARENGGCSKVLKNPSMRRNHHIDSIEQHQGTNILQALDGFALAVAADGRFLYISETVSIYLGLSQVELTGSSIFDYIHQQDHEEIAEALGLKLTSTQNGSSSAGIASPSSGGSEEGQGGSHGTNNPDVSASMVFQPDKGYERSFAIRMKSTLTKRGVHFKSSGFRLVLIQCRLRPQLSFSHTNKSQTPLLGMVGIAVVPPPPSVHEIRLESDMFVTRINFDFKIAHCEPRVSDLLDYLPEELVGKSIYNLCHAEDSSGLRKAHSDLINKGQSQTNYYRIMNKDGGYTWMQTIATVVCSLKNAEEQSIICINYVLSNREESSLILDCCQLETKIEDIKSEDIKPDNNSGSPNADPTAEGLPGPQGPTAEPQLISPKQESEPRSRRARNNNNNIMQLGKDAKNDEIISPALTPTQKRAQKRKIKADQEEISNLEPPKSSPALIDRTRHPGLEDHSETSVKDLENAMSKHLPSPGGSSTTDFSTDALLKQQQEKSSTIQWIGTPHYQQPGMPATALLRQLYANRESVIRATARQTPTGGVFYSDGQNGPLPTPPGSESSFDNQFLQLHSHGQKSSDAFTNLVSTYSGYHTSLDYHNAMTPPSSVSPRESGNTLTTMKNASQNPPPPGATYDYGDPLRSQYVSPNQTIDVTGPNSTPALPLKPQPYSVAAMHHPDPSATYSNLEQSQYFSPHHSSFHLYHKGTPAVAPPPTSSGWYSTPS